MQMMVQLVLEVENENRVTIQYISTEQMRADGLIKALLGEDFKEFVNAVLGKLFLSKSTSERWVSLKGLLWGACWLSPERYLQGVGYDTGTCARKFEESKMKVDLD